MRIVVPALAVLLTACTPAVDSTRHVVDLSAVDWEVLPQVGMGDPMPVELEGDLPVVGAFAGPTAFGHATYDPQSSWRQAVLHFEQQDDGWSMIDLGLEIDPETHEASFYSWSGLGCAGPEAGQMDFDADPIRVELEVDRYTLDDLGVVELTVTEVFRDDHVVVGTMVLPAVDE
jgi:hypothetical protein